MGIINEGVQTEAGHLITVECFYGKRSRDMQLFLVLWDN